MTRAQIEALRAGYIATNGLLSADDEFHALFEHALTEQSRTDAAVEKERERCAAHLEQKGRVFEETADRAGTLAREGRLRAASERLIWAAKELRAPSPTPATEEGE